MTRVVRKARASLISSHLSGIKRALLEGEKRATFLDFLNTALPARQGIYLLYDKKGRLYYAGKASDLARRLNQHLRDRHDVETYSEGQEPSRHLVVAPLVE